MHKNHQIKRNMRWTFCTLCSSAKWCCWKNVWTTEKYCSNSTQGIQLFKDIMNQGTTMHYIFWIGSLLLLMSFKYPTKCLVGKNQIFYFFRLFILRSMDCMNLLVSKSSISHPLRDYILHYLSTIPMMPIECIIQG